MVQQALNKKIFSVLAILLLNGCASDEHVSMVNKTPEEVYQEAEKMLKNRDFSDAAKKFRDVDTYFPYTEKAAQSQVMSGYCSFLAEDYVDALRTLEVFLRYHPSHVLVPYALYLRAMCFYVNIPSVGRDYKKALEAKNSFVELINRFPNSPYVEDSVKRVIILDDIIAAHELMVGRYYQKNKSALAAISRYNRVVGEFAHTRSCEEAYYRIWECCKAAQLNDEANTAAEALKSQFPKGHWCNKLQAGR